MSDVKRLDERLECMLFRARFPEEIEELKPVSCCFLPLYVDNIQCNVVLLY